MAELRTKSGALARLGATDVITVKENNPRAIGFR
jgi:hypothetical protein